MRLHATLVYYDSRTSETEPIPCPEGYPSEIEVNVTDLDDLNVENTIAFAVIDYLKAKNIPVLGYLSSSYVTKEVPDVGLN